MAGYKHLEIPGDFQSYVKDKKKSATSYYRYFLARCTRMFEYKNLPDTIEHQILDRYLFNNGIACITEVNSKLYVFYGNLGGPQDVYYRPTEFIISNPHIKTASGELFTANVPVFPCDDNEGSTTGVLIRNDTEWQGLAPMLMRYSYLMAENILTLRTADVLLRVVAMLTAPSDKERAAALEYLKSLEKGELGVIGESPFFDGVKLQSPPSNNGSYLTQFIEYQQYLKGSLYNELGLSANYNMKREAIGKGESTLDEDALLPLCDNMLMCRRQDLEKVNQMYGTKISVDFSSAWLENRLETTAALYQMLPFGAGLTTGAAQDVVDEADGANEKVEDSEDGENGNVGEDGANGAAGDLRSEDADETEGEAEDSDTGSETADDSTDESGDESRINDMSQDEMLDDAMDAMLEGIEEGGQPPMIPDEEKGENGEDAETEKGSDNQGTLSDN